MAKFVADSFIPRRFTFSHEAPTKNQHLGQCFQAWGGTGGCPFAELAENHGVEAVATAEFPAPSGFLGGLGRLFRSRRRRHFAQRHGRSRRHDVPVAGIRHGQLGFLATFSPEDMEAKIPALFRGEYRISRRSMLRYRDESVFQSGVE